MLTTRTVSTATYHRKGHAHRDYYTLRFQIEFNFRDAKQFWGLEDFMNIKHTPLTNAANLAFFMVNLSSILRQRWHPLQPAFSILDLKAHCRALKYVTETLKLLPQQPEPFVIQLISAQLARSVLSISHNGEGIAVGRYFLFRLWCW